MAIEVRIPKEITEYKEKIIFGLTIRKLICLTSAIVICVGTYLLLTFVLRITSDTAGYFIVFISMLIMAVGFYEKDGIPFEKYVALRLRHSLGRTKLKYETELIIENVLMVIPKVKTEAAAERKSRYVSSFKNGGKIHEEKECNAFTITKKGRKAKSKAIRRSIKAAGKDYQSAKCRIEKESSAKGRAQNRTAANQI